MQKQEILPDHSAKSHSFLIHTSVNLVSEIPVKIDNFHGKFLPKVKSLQMYILQGRIQGCSFDPQN